MSANSFKNLANFVFPYQHQDRTTLVLYNFVEPVVIMRKQVFMACRIFSPQLTATATSEPEKPSVFLAKSSKSHSDKLWGVSPR